MRSANKSMKKRSSGVGDAKLLDDAAQREARLVFRDGVGVKRACGALWGSKVGIREDVDDTVQ